MISTREPNKEQCPQDFPCGHPKPTESPFSTTTPASFLKQVLLLPIERTQWAFLF
jgi:hypothetical protein